MWQCPIVRDDSRTPSPNTTLTAWSKIFRAYVDGERLVKRVSKILLAPPLDAAGCRRGQRVVRRGMPWIAPAHLGFDVRIAAAPETGQIARHLHRPVRRRQQFDH